MPLASSLAEQLLADRTLRDLVQFGVVVEDERQVEDLEFLHAQRAELGERGREHLHRAELQRLHLLLVLVQRRVGVDLDLDLALGELAGALGEELARLALGRVVGDDVAELDDDRRLCRCRRGECEGAGDGGNEGQHVAARGACGSSNVSCSMVVGSVEAADLRRLFAATDHFQPIATILRRTKAIWVCSGNCFGQTSWQPSSDMQPNTPSSSPTSVVEVLVAARVARVEPEARDLVQADGADEVLAHARRAAGRHAAAALDAAVELVDLLGQFGLHARFEARQVGARLPAAAPRSAAARSCRASTCRC